MCISQFSKSCSYSVKGLLRLFNDGKKIINEEMIMSCKHCGRLVASGTVDEDYIKAKKKDGFVFLSLEDFKKEVEEKIKKVEKEKAGRKAS